MEGQTVSRGVRYDIRCVMGDSVNLGYFTVRKYRNNTNGLELTFA